MDDDMRNSAPEDRTTENKIALELVFIAVVGLFVAGGFISALNYDFVSARAPIVIMVPLLILIAVQMNRTRRQGRGHVVVQQLKFALRGNIPEFNSVARFTAFMSLLLVLIFVAGHYIGISLFMFVLMYWISREHPVLALLVSIGVTLLIYVLFEHGFNIELYRGYIPRLLSGYGVF